jgi:hypothetical protein
MDASYVLQYGSDFHLDSKSPPFSLLIEPACPDLALCGDLGNPFSQIYSDFIHWCARRWTRVFVIAGNHEYFVKDSAIGMNDTEAQIRSVCAAAGGNVIFLQKDLYFIESHKLVIAGATLWSTPELRRWSQMSADFLGNPGVRGEYNAIFKHDEYTDEMRPLHPSDITEISVNQVTWLRGALNSAWGSIPEGWRVIVLSHYLPTYKLNQPRFADHPLRSCYSNAYDDLLQKPVVAWVCGHSHTAKTLRFDTGCLVTLNPLGYEKEAGKNGYRRRATIVVYPENIATAM